MVDKLKEEAGLRNLHPFKQKSKSYADDLPNRVIKRMLEEKVE